MDNTFILQMQKIVKEFDKVRVLDNVNFDLKKGEVHALVGANGAGKSTLMKILNGVFINYGGDILVDGQKVNFQNPIDAYNHGIAMIHQELDLVTNLNVSDNIYLGREIKNKGGLDRKTMHHNTQKLMDSLGFPIRADEVVEKLPASMQQLVLIARVVDMNAKVVVMDEPTSSLSINEIEKLFAVIKGLCDKGISVVYISHFLEEIFRIANRVTVLRDGKNVITKDIQECTKPQIVEWMVGHKRDTGRNFVRACGQDAVLLSVKDLTQRRGIVKNASFDLKKGEVLGIAGVVGSGRSELVRMIFGAEEKSSGSIVLEDKNVEINSPKKAVALKIALIPEDRKKEGLILKRTISDNISLAVLKDCSKNRIINYKKVTDTVSKMVQDMRIKCSSAHQEVQYLSGGNQQKVVLGKWLSAKSKILILDQPTRGVDVGVKEEIYTLVDRLAQEGTSIIFVSDEMEEVLSLCDRILVMKKGQIICELDNRERLLTKVDLLTSMVSDETTQGKVVI